MSKRNISLSSRLNTLSFADSQPKPPAASSSILLPTVTSKPSSSRTRQVPESSKDRNNTSNARSIASHPKHLPPVQGPRTEPVGPSTISEKRSATGEALRAGSSSSVKLGPPFEHKPAQHSSSKHTQAVNPQQSTLVSRPRLPASLPPWEPPPPSPVSSPDVPQASPPVLPGEQVDWEGPNDDVSGLLNIAHRSLQTRTSFTTTPPPFLPLHLLFETLLLLFNRHPHALLRRWHPTCQAHLHRNTSRQDLH